MDILIKSIPGFPGYKITSQGEVISYKRQKKGYKLTQHLNHKGYPVVGIMDELHKQHTIPVHRLMLKTFKPRDNMDQMTVNHIDGVKTNNKLENLEWLSSSDNVKDARERNITWGPKKGYSHYGGKIQITFPDGHKEIYSNITEASEKSGYCRKTLRRYLNNNFQTTPRVKIKVEII